MTEKITYPYGTTVYPHCNGAVLFVKTRDRGWLRLSLTRGHIEPSSWTDEYVTTFQDDHRIVLPK